MRPVQRNYPSKHSYGPSFKATHTVHSEFNIDQYLARISYNGPREPSVEVLHALTRAHAQSVPFENIDVLLNKPISLEIPDLYNKIVLSRRGGYCFELNGLFLELLAKLGFEVRPLGARVRLGVSDRHTLPERTHMLIEVCIRGQKWISDVGVGSTSLTSALQLKNKVEQTTPHGIRRLVFEGQKWFHQVRQANQWVDVYEFTQETIPLPDRIVANWYTSTYPDSLFRKRLIAALAQPDGHRVAISDKTLRFWQPDASSEEHLLDSNEAVLQALHKYFNLCVPAVLW